MPPTLRERDHELRQLTEMADELASGTGRAVVIEAAAGIGKTALLAMARRHSAGAGLTVLAARGAQIERENAYGVVRQLFEPVVTGAGPQRRATLLAGSARLAAPLMSGDDVPAPGATDSSFGVLHGLYWLAANIAQVGPVLLVIDDAHWADNASLRFLGYLARRLEGLPIGLLVATRPAEITDTTTLLADITGDPATTVLRPAPLTAASVAEMVSASLRQPCDPAFASACHEVTGGTPFLVEELLRALHERGTEPVAEHAPAVRALAPPRVARHFLQRLARLAPEAVSLARAVAVLGPGTDLAHAAEVAGLPRDVASMTADALATARIFEDSRPLTFIHPLVATAIAAEPPAGERARIHLRAARLFADDPATIERAAAHLLATEPVGEPWAVRVLRATAARAVGHGAPDAAVTYLVRALAEPLERRSRAEVLADLGFAQSYTGDPAASTSLEQALALTDDAAARVAITLALGRILQLAGEHVRAVDVFMRAVAATARDPHRREGQVDDRAELLLRGALLGAQQMQISSAEAARAEWRRLRARVEKHPDPPPSVFGPLATGCVFAGEPADCAATFARRALTGSGRLLPEGPDRPPFFYHACAGLLFTDHYAEVAAHLDRALADAVTLGAIQHLIGLSAFRSALNLRQGRLADAEADARQALSAGSGSSLFGGLASASLAEVLIEWGDFDAAESVLGDAGLDSSGRDGSGRDAGGRESSGRDGGGDQHAFVGLALVARGRLRLARGNASDALQDLLAAGDIQRRLCADTPAMVGWRSEAAAALLRLGRDADAVALAEEEVALARRVGAPRAIGIALRAHGLALAEEPGLALLDEAVTTLASARAPVEHARALVELGAALRRSGQRAAAREHLAEGLDLAHRHGARALGERAREELVAAGARPRRLVTTGVDALTASERRVAILAAQGLTNREIAQALFVTARTVEGHLTAAFQKLGVTSRKDLPSVLDS